jgi:GTP-binding protein HflX
MQLAQDKRLELSVAAERAVLVGVILPNSSADPRDPLGELASLTKTAGAEVVATVVQNRHKIDPSTFIGAGKAEEIKKIVELHKANVVIFDHDMSPNQLRDLEEIINVKILDRSELILDIFATRAKTHEAQLQIELAQLQYTYPRLRHMWSHLERISGSGGAGVGARGPGEMQLEIDRRIIRDRVSDLKANIREVQERRSREVKSRKRQHFTISLVGYTNAGKSTMFNTLTGEQTFVEDKLFATLDTKTRRWHLGGAHSALVSDTVGFVRDLPHHLVASFKATLEEATHADMLLLVLDVSHPHAQLQLKTVVQVLQDIGCGDIPALLVLNKIDAVENKDDLAFWKSMFPDALPASAKEGDGVVELTEVVRDQMLGQVMKATVAVPLSDPKGITFIEKFSEVMERDYDTKPGIVNLSVEMSQRIVDQLANNVPTAKVLKIAAMKAGGAKAKNVWRCRTKPIKELIPEGFLEGKEKGASDEEGAAAARPVKGAGLTIGKKKIAR